VLRRINLTMRQLALFAMASSITGFAQNASVAQREVETKMEQFQRTATWKQQA
jgi:hypothetical protein